MEQKAREYCSDELNGCSNGDGRVLLWEDGLPDADNVTPLCQSLISQELAAAFRILAEPRRTVTDVDSASNTTMLNIRDGQSEGYGSFESIEDRTRGGDVMVVESEDSGSDSQKLRKVDLVEEANLAPEVENLIEDAAKARTVTLKRPRIAWTPQLHKRFVDVVSHLGLKDAAPKAIMQLMNVEGLTRENVASHLQKYRLYLKRTQLSSTTDEALVPVPTAQKSLDSAAGAGCFPATFPMAYAPPQMMPMMYFGMGGHISSMPMANPSNAPTHNFSKKGQQD